MLLHHMYIPTSGGKCPPVQLVNLPLQPTHPQLHKLAELFTKINSLFEGHGFL